MRYPFVVDFGPPSSGGWLTRVIASELQVEEASMLDVIEHQLILGGRRVDLTRLEFEVFRYLHEHQGHGRWTGHRCCARSGATTTPAAAMSSMPS